MNIEQMRIKFKDWWEQFKSEHDDWRWADQEALLFQAWQAGLSAKRTSADDDYYGTYDSEDFGFNLRDFYCNEKELIDKGLIIPLYLHPQPPDEAGKVRDLEVKLIEALTELCDEFDKHGIHTALSETNILWFKRKAREALAAMKGE